MARPSPEYNRAINIGVDIRREKRAAQEWVARVEQVEKDYMKWRGHLIEGVPLRLDELRPPQLQPQPQPAPPPQPQAKPQPAPPISDEQRPPNVPLQ